MVVRGLKQARELWKLFEYGIDGDGVKFFFERGVVHV
jgi:hypothetical protein